MEFRIISLPPFRAISSGVDRNFDFSDTGILGKFDKYFSALKIADRDSFLPRDFLFYDEEEKGLVWWFALTDETPSGSYEIVDFEGGYYLTYAYKDGDEETNSKLYKQAMEFIKKSENIELDIRKNHYPMGHIITPPKIIEAQGWAQMETFIPIRIKRG